MIKCVRDECSWPECDKTCGLVPSGDYVIGSSAEEKLIYHLQQRIGELLNEQSVIRQNMAAAQYAFDNAYKFFRAPDIEYEACKKACKFGLTDCIHNPEYLRRNYPDWWIELGMPIDCPDCNDKCCHYDDEDK